MNTIRVIRKEGHYNWANQSEKEAQWIIKLPDDSPVEHNTISQTLGIDSEYDLIGEDDPWIIADAIERYLNSLWVSTNRKQQLIDIKWFKDNESILRPLWIRDKITECNRKIKKIEDEKSKYEEELAELTAKGESK